MTDEHAQGAALRAVRDRAAVFADAINRVSKAQQDYVIALGRATELGATQEGLHFQVELACKDRPDREHALNSYMAQLDKGGS